MKTITPIELAQKLQNDEVTILDVRASEKYNDYHINGKNVHSLNIEKTAFFEDDMEKISALPKNKEIIVTCTTGNSAKKCGDILSKKGYDVTLLAGGITAWKEKNN